MPFADVNGQLPSNSEVNHVQLIPAGGPLSVAQSATVWDPDPSCG
jgi:hypothetical protein